MHIPSVNVSAFLYVFKCDEGERRDRLLMRAREFTLIDTNDQSGSIFTIN